MLASILWLLLAYPVETVQRTYVVPIEYRNVPAGYAVEETGVRLAEITLSGTERAFSELDAEKLVMAADVGTVAAGSAQFVPTTGPDDLPPGLKATRVEPHQVPVILKRLTSSEASQQGSEAK